MIKSRRLRWAGHVGKIGKVMSAFKILADKTIHEHYETI